MKFNHFWQFIKLSIESNLDDFLNKKESLRNITLPHDFLIEDSNNLYETCKGWYYKEFNIDPSKDKEYFLYFEGVYMDSKIYVNNKLAYEWKNGYTSFKVNISKHLIKGNNNIIVEVLHQHPNSRWYSGAGIYRDVYLIEKNYSYFEDVYIKTLANKEEIIVHTNIINNDNYKIRFQVFEKDNIIYDEIDSSLNKNITINKPKLWSIKTPNLYLLKLTLLNDNEQLDTYAHKIGFKDLIMDPKLGLILNKEKLKLNGVCEHHDLGSLGAAFSPKILKSRLIKLKKMGVNAIRTAHYVPAKGLMEIADEMGFLIVSEAFDMWQRPKTTYDYARFFKEWKAKDVESWIKRDRNHVSLLMWSIGNEIYDTHVDENGLIIAKELTKLVREHDYMNNAEITIGSNFLMGENAIKVTDYLKYAGYNYAENLYDEHHKKYPDWIIYGSETASIVQSRGIYHFPLEADILFDEDKQCSSLGNSTTSWGARSYEDVITIDRSKKYSLGQFIWTGYDYIGEPTPYETKNSYFGQLDTAGFEKDSYYVYKAAWNQEEPLIHIFPYWQFNEGEIIDVRVVSNTSRIELYLNERLIANENVNINDDIDIIKTFKIPYKKGVLKAIGYDENGNEVAVSKRVSFGDPVKIKTNVSNKTIKADGEDLTEIEVYVVDKDNNIVENANLPVNIEIKGNAKLLGTDNGDSTDYTSYKSYNKRLFSGKLKVIIGSTLIPDNNIEVSFKNKYLEESVVNLNSIETDLSIEQALAKRKNNFVRSFQSEEEITKDDFIPISRIELIANNKLLNLETPSTIVNYKIEPSYATKQPINFKIVNEKGIKVNNAKIIETKDGVLVEALGDGEFILRATTNNKKNHPDIISELSFKVEGMGISNKSAYELVTAGLYDEHTGDIKAGNEHGIATSNENLTSVIYNNIDFGSIGSNVLNLSIFSFESSELLVDLEVNELNGNSYYRDKLKYCKETIWNVYQQEKYELKKRIYGIKNIKLTFSRSVHFKGFKFDKTNKAYEKLSSSDCDEYYGDDFIKEDWGFKNIGNNTSFKFNKLNFDKEIRYIDINGKSNTDNNTIRVQFTLENGTKTINNLEFKYSDNFEIQTFEIKPIIGIAQVEFIFLPGSNFDFKWFKFIPKKGNNSL